MRSAFLALALGACTTAAPAPDWVPGAPSELTGITWMRVDDEDASPHFATLRFEADRIAGHGGCNRYFADVAHAGSRLRLGDIGSTRMMCPPSSMATERSMFAALARVRGYRLANEELTLLDENGAAAARFMRAD
jgi:heat shock protein HslJ